MRILWYTNTPCNYNQNSAYNGGGWLSALQNLLEKTDDVELGIAFALDGEPEKVKTNSVTYFPMKFPHKSFWEKFRCVLGTKKGFVKSERNRYSKYEEILKFPIEDFKPDIIMVFGSEQPMGLIASLTDIPVVLHIQGILTPFLNAYLPPFVSWKSYINSSHDIKKILLRSIEHKRWVANCEREQEIYKRVKYYFGRTDWDYRLTKILKPNAEYFYSSEILRPVFYEQAERKIPKKLTIVTTISNPLYKGYDLVLKTAQRLVRSHVEFEWKCFGNIDPRTIERILKIKHENVNVSLCGVATPEDLKRALLQSTVYVHTSYIDNSPNSLCEAQILGCTPIATYVGGVPSLIQDGVTGYLVPANDPFQLAYLIEDVFAHVENNVAIGKAAQVIARKRHDRNGIVEKLLNDLNTIIYKNKI